jgi:hypothetical protein
MSIVGKRWGADGDEIMTAAVGPASADRAPGSFDGTGRSAAVGDQLPRPAGAPPRPGAAGGGSGEKQ